MPSNIGAGVFTDLEIQKRVEQKLPLYEPLSSSEPRTWNGSAAWQWLHRATTMQPTAPCRFFADLAGVGPWPRRIRCRHRARGRGGR